jgi:hypothetical protein
VRKTNLAFLALCATFIWVGAGYAAGGGLPACEASLTAETAALKTCESDLTTETNSFNSCNTNLTSCVNEVGALNVGLSTETNSFNTCNTNLTSCINEVGALNVGLSQVNSSLSLCETADSVCESNLKTAQLCGNDAIDPGEQCDQGNLNGRTCASLGFVGGTLKCGAGCQFDTSGCTSTRFVDNGDGTVTDNQTGLMWEKKTAGGLDNVNATFTWTGTFDNSASGTAFTSFLPPLNPGTSTDGGATTPILGCFANHCDWRLPSIVELQGIVDTAAAGCNLQNQGPCIDPTFGPTQFNLQETPTPFYWSATSNAGIPSQAWFVDFSLGGVESAPKTDALYVRAVRGP